MAFGLLIAVLGNATSGSTDLALAYGVLFLVVIGVAVFLSRRSAARRSH